MKIAVASDDALTIAAHFGRTRGFLIYETEEGEIKGREYRPNDFTGHAQGLHLAGAHHNPHGGILEALGDCRVVISHGMGRRLYDDLRNHGIEAFIVRERDADLAVKLYLEQKLKDDPESGCEH